MAIAGTTYLLELAAKISTAPGIKELEANFTGSTFEMLVRDEETGQVARLSLRPMNEEPEMSGIRSRATSCVGCYHRSHPAGECGEPVIFSRTPCRCTYNAGEAPER